jgi:exonuclease III
MQGGFADVWHELRPASEGYTCCQDGDLANEAPGLNQRIDYVFARGFGQGDAAVRGEIVKVGFRPTEKVMGPVYPVWPSDHAGLVAWLFLPAVQ